MGEDLKFVDSEYDPLYTDSPTFGPIYINNKKIPHPDYGIGATGASWSGASTCVAHAKFIYNYIWGSVDYGTAYNNKSFSSSNELHSMVGNAKLGSRMTLFRPDGSSHTFIIVSFSATNLTVYHSNYGNKNKVTVTRFTYDELVQRFNRASYYRPN